MSGEVTKGHVIVDREIDQDAQLGAGNRGPEKGRPDQIGKQGRCSNGDSGGDAARKQERGHPPRLAVAR